METVMEAESKTVFGRWRTPTDPREHRVKMLAGAPLISRRRFVVSKVIAVSVVMVWLGAIIASARLLDGVAKWLVIAFFALTLPAVSASDILQTYRAYATEWHDANPERT